MVVMNASESWEVTLDEFIEVMHEQPEDMTHALLYKYLKDIFGRVNVEMILDCYSPMTERIIELAIDSEAYRTLLQAMVVGSIDEGKYYLSIRTSPDPETIATYPESFIEPGKTPLFLLALEYLVQIAADRALAYTSDTPIEILRYHADTMYIIPSTL
jgi:hypothetical protein